MKVLASALRFAARAGALGALSSTVSVLGGCAGGGPLLHAARALDTGDVRGAVGVSANAATFGLAKALRDARAQGVVPTAPTPSPAGSTYARGALVAAAVAPGVAPFVAARFGLGDRFEAGLGYTGRGARLDARRSFDHGGYSLSLGAGAFGAFSGSDGSGGLAGVQTENLRGYGADVPVLVGWQSDNGLYMAWAGVRGGIEHDSISNLTSEPKSVTIGTSPIDLEATRVWGGGVVGLAAGFHYVHVALEADVGYQHVAGRFGPNEASIDGLTVVPAGAVWIDLQ